MALDKQIQLYQIGTNYLYSNTENYWHCRAKQQRQERNLLEEIINEFKKKAQKDFGIGESVFDSIIKSGDLPELNIEGTTNIKIVKRNRHGKTHTHNYEWTFNELMLKAIEYYSYLPLKRKVSEKKSDAMLRQILTNKSAQTEITNGKHHIRELRTDMLKDNDVVGSFDSYLTRTIGLETNTKNVTDELIIIRVYFYDVLKDIIESGFMWNGEKYIYFSSSAGQLRKRKIVCIKESTWLRIHDQIMCGLTKKKISDTKINTNKFLAYLALCNSATDVWEEFDIDRAIVVEDFETGVEGEAEFVDDTTFEITRQINNFTITHTDGAGMALPSFMKKSAMIRMPWVKGLIGLFDFRKFIEEYNCSPVVCDIWGNYHNIIDEDIQIILTKSQLKLWNMYESFDEYKYYYKKFGCTCGLCSVEEDFIKDCHFNYQMMQSLVDMTDDEILDVASRSIDRLNRITQDKKTMDQIMGLNKRFDSLNPFQKCLKIYPSLYHDQYCKDKLQSIKNSLVKQYKYAKLDIDGKFTFIFPDYFAFCEWLFKGIESPKGLLKDGEVYCKLYKKNEKLAILRSPHLYREWPIRKNIAYSYSEDEDFNNAKKKCDKWFVTDGVYTSCSDLISRVLQFDKHKCQAS